MVMDMFIVFYGFFWLGVKLKPRFGVKMVNLNFYYIAGFSYEAIFTIHISINNSKFFLNYIDILKIKILI